MRHLTGERKIPGSTPELGKILFTRFVFPFSLNFNSPVAPAVTLATPHTFQYIYIRIVRKCHAHYHCHHNRERRNHYRRFELTG